MGGGGETGGGVHSPCGGAGRYRAGPCRNPALSEDPDGERPGIVRVRRTGGVSHAESERPGGPPPAQRLSAITDYGTAFTAVARRDNFCGTQFHPERSGVVGSRILGNFLKEGA